MSVEPERIASSVMMSPTQTAKPSNGNSTPRCIKAWRTWEKSTVKHYTPFTKKGRSLNEMSD
ncbi:MAG: hypothetical protein VX438_17230 [Planctomycetota bacterium]|nr:hypothetical protein [Planctomycetota bacterium]